MAANKQNLDQSATLYFILKPFKTMFTVLVLFLTLLGLSLTSLLTLCNRTELSQISQFYGRLHFSHDQWNIVISQWCYNALNTLFFDVTRISYLMTHSVPRDSLLLGYQRYLFAHLEQLNALQTALVLVSMRFGILVVYCFTVVLAVVAMAVFDGFMERAVRRSCLGRESASIYHQSKFMRGGAVILFLIVYFGWPMYFDPIWLMVAAIGLGVLIRTQAKYYKKYV